TVRLTVDRSSSTLIPARSPSVAHLKSVPTRPLSLRKAYRNLSPSEPRCAIGLLPAPPGWWRPVSPPLGPVSQSIRQRSEDLLPVARRRGGEFRHVGLGVVECAAIRGRHAVLGDEIRETATHGEQHHAGGRGARDAEAMRNVARAKREAARAEPDPGGSHDHLEFTFDNVEPLVLLVV